jgi:flagellar biosynthesis/type III secretory pathway protein FliH
VAGILPFLEDFGNATPATANTPRGQSDDDTEKLTSDAYEKGYQAGWDDCLDGNRTHNNVIAEALGRRLGQLEIDITAVRAGILDGLQPLLADILQKILPSVAHVGFRDQLVSQLIDLSVQSTQTAVSILVSPDEEDAIRALLDQHADLPVFTLRADSALGLTQAQLRVGNLARTIDIMKVIDGIEDAFDAVTLEKEIRIHG